MALAPYIALERAMNTSTSTGTGNMVLGAAVDGYVTLDQAPLADDADYTFPYCIEGIDGACAGEVERGIGAIVSGELVRGLQYRVNAGVWASGAQTFSAGTKRIYLRTQPPAEDEANFITAITNFSNLAGFARCTASGNTTNATPTVLDGYLFHSAEESLYTTGSTFDIAAVPGGGTGPVAFRLTITATDGTDNKAWAFDFLALHNGTASIIGSPSPTVLGASGGASTWDVDVDVTGSDVEIVVTGEAAKNIHWACSGSFL